MLKKVAKPSDCGKLTKPLDLVKFKAVDYRDLFLFELELLLMDQTDPQAIEIILQQSYVYKSVLLEQPQFKIIPQDDLDKLNVKFLKNFQDRFGLFHMVYNPHVQIHLPECRRDYDLTDVSCVPFESSFGDLNRNTAVGTHSTTKSKIEKTFLGMELCQKFEKEKFQLKLSTKSNIKTDDTLISITPESFGKVIAIDQNKITARKFKIKEYGRPPPLMPSLPWKYVGVFEVVDLTNETVELLEHQIYGKAIVRNSTIMTVPRNLLREK